MRSFHEFKPSQVKAGLYLMRMSLDFTSGKMSDLRKPRNEVEC